MQIRVINTKIHKIISYEKANLFDNHDTEYYQDVPAVEGKLILVECQPEEALFYCVGDLKNVVKCDVKQQGIVKGIGKYYKPIIISETEKIDVGDWVTDGQRIAQVNVLTIDDPNKDKHYKILALPEHFSPKHLQAIVDGEIKHEDKMLVECEDSVAIDGHTITGKEIKHNLLDHITLHKIEEKMYTREEIKELFRKLGQNITYSDTASRIMDWFERNVK